MYTVFHNDPLQEYSGKTKNNSFPPLVTSNYTTLHTNQALNYFRSSIFNLHVYLKQSLNNSFHGLHRIQSDTIMKSAIYMSYKR